MKKLSLAALMLTTLSCAGCGAATDARQLDNAGGTLPPDVAELIKNAKRSVDLYKAFKTSEIVRGQEQEPTENDEMVVFDREYVTPNPDWVEVVELGGYGDLTWSANAKFSRAWRKSLPDDVDIHRIPAQSEEVDPDHPVADHRPVHRSVFFAGKKLRGEDAIHLAMMQTLVGKPHGLKTDDDVARLARRLRIEPQALQQARNDPTTRWQAKEARWLAQIVAHMRTRKARETGKASNPVVLFPMLIVNGRYLVDAARIGSPKRVYRLANRLIRQELEGRPHRTGPTNDAEFTATMAEHEGEIRLRRVNGDLISTTPLAVVYAPQETAVWWLDYNGRVLRAPRLTDKGRESHFEFRQSNGDTGRLEMWRYANQYESFLDTDGKPIRHPAFTVRDTLPGLAYPLFVSIDHQAHDVWLNADGTLRGKGPAAPVGVEPTLVSPAAKFVMQGPSERSCRGQAAVGVHGLCCKVRLLGEVSARSAARG